MPKAILTAIAIAGILFVLVAGIQHAKAQFLTITIKADGSIVPSNTLLQKEGNTYLITSDIVGTITVEKGDIVVDGANYTLWGPGADQNFIAITLMANNVTVENLHVIGWRAGVYGAYNNCTIANNVFASNYQAIAVYADDYIIERNSISGSSDAAILIDGGAVRLQGDNNLITQNQIANNNWAFDILNSNGTTISKNNVTGNKVILTLGTQHANNSVAGFHMLYLNNFVGNAQTLHVPFGGPFISGVVPLSPAGQWDNGSAGNYWSDYQSRYPNAAEIGNSGIGNTSYMINESTTYSDDYANGTHISGIAILGTAIDRYPLISPYNSSNIAIGLPYPSPSPSPNKSHASSPSTSSSSSPSLSPSPTRTSSPSPSPSVPEFPPRIVIAFLVIASATFLVATRKLPWRTKR
jgi:parallel beta-helix repeat protein